MAVLVTGGAGYIGSHMVYELLDKGKTVIVLDDLSTGHKRHLPANTPLFVGKCGDTQLVASIVNAFNVDAILHFAASRRHETDTAESRSLFKTARENGVEHIVFSSSAAVYGNPAAVPVKENAALNPVSSYGASKLLTEIILQDADLAHGLKHVSLRYFCVTGADPGRRTGQSGKNATHVVKVAAQAALGLRETVPIFGEDYATPDGTCIRDYVHVTDLVKAHTVALDYLRSGGASCALNVGYGHGFSVREVIEAVRRVSGIRFGVKTASRRAGDPAELIADNTLISEKLRWLPSHDDLDGIVAHALAWEENLLRLAKKPSRPSSKREAPAAIFAPSTGSQQMTGAVAS